MCAITVAAVMFFQTPLEQPVVMVLTSKGTVAFERGKETPRRAGAMTLLRRGDRVQVPAAAEATLRFLDDGHRDAQAAANLESVCTLATSSRGAVGVLRGDPPPRPQLVTPLYGATILSDRPTLTWRDVKAEAYLVHLLSGAEGKAVKVLWKATVKETRLPYPEKEKALGVGRKYRWRVTPLKGDDANAEPIVESKFFLSTKDEMGRLANLKPLLDSTSPADQLLAAACYEAHGVYNEALRLDERLAETSPEEASFQTALGSYYERAGRKDLAATAQQRANKLEAEAAGT